MAGLSVKQQNFADELINGGSAKQAAIKAGYSKKYAAQNADKLLKNTNVKSYLDKRRKEISDAKIADATEILEFLTAVKRDEVTESVVTPKGVYDNVPLGGRDRIKAAELLGKRFAMWTENRNINANVGPVQIIDDVPDADPPTVVDGFKGGDDNG